MRSATLIAVLLAYIGCSVHSLPQKRVIGGQITDIADLPYLVQIHSRSVGSANVESRCGGSIVSERWILTAAHCFHGSEEFDRYVVSNSSTWGSWDSNPNIPIDCTKDCISHPDYGVYTANNDIGLIYIRGDYVFAADQIVRLAEDSPSAGTLLTIGGWGLGPTGSDYDLLHSIQIPALDLSVCRQNLLPTITDNQLCAGYEEAGRNACSGDSGSPLARREQEEFVQYGLVSVGYICADPKSYVVYSNVASLRAWIDGVVQSSA